MRKRGTDRRKEQSKPDGRYFYNRTQFEGVLEKSRGQESKVEMKAIKREREGAREPLTDLKRETPLIIQQALQISNTVEPLLCSKKIKKGPNKSESKIILKLIGRPG